MFNSRSDVDQGHPWIFYCQQVAFFEISDVLKSWNKFGCKCFLAIDVPEASKYLFNLEKHVFSLL